MTSNAPAAKPFTAPMSSRPSTSAPFSFLDEVLEVWLLNAGQIKAVRERKTVRDAEAVP